MVWGDRQDFSLGKQPHICALITDGNLALNFHQNLDLYVRDLSLELWTAMGQWQHFQFLG